ncbi:MAG: nicotinate phosphoribosyltransferase [Clostridia bacterium]|jgi:nicotinate phosphoribosyltransferase|nr:nicotinate phosphoribosyltransferase [Clostridia bacterium]
MRNLTLLTDLYEITMMQAYFKNNNKNKMAIFDVFYRKNPMDGGYAISAGLEQVIEYINNLHFTEDDINYLASLKIFEDDFLGYLKNFKFTGDIYAIPEGSVIFPREPMLKVIAPIMEAQFIETAILNILNHQSLIATKAARICYAAEGDGIMEFGLRRAQGPDAGIYGARAAVIGGCAGTSNVLTGQMFDVPVMGTHAHSWIMSFDDEYTAFYTYAKLYPMACTLLVDTYDTLNSGVPNAIKVFKQMKKEGIELKNYGIRLDSGDLAYLSKKARKMLDDAGFKDATITASNDLDEFLIASLKMQGAEITNWGVGTNLITSKDCPSFGGVYKLAAIMEDGENFTPKIKLSDNSEKITNPGNKKIYRIYEKENNKIKADLICLENETFTENEDMHLFDPHEPWKKTVLKAGTFTLKEMLVKVFDKGQCVYHSDSVMKLRDFAISEMETLWEETKRFENPHQVYVDLSQKLYDIKISLLEKMSKE